MITHRCLVGRDVVRVLLAPVFRRVEAAIVVYRMHGFLRKMVRKRGRHKVILDTHQDMLVLPVGESKAEFENLDGDGLGFLDDGWRVRAGWSQGGGVTARSNRRHLLS
jgi:hypothetical protein